MASDNSSSAAKWLLGCGCAAAVVLALCAGAAVMLVPKAFRAAKEQVGKELERQAFAGAWEPPADDAGPEQLFPAAVDDGKLELVASDESAAVPEFNLDLSGDHATYATADSNVEVYVFRASPPEAEAVFERVKKAIDEGNFNFRTTVEINNRLTFKVSPPQQTGYLWHSKGWLVFFLAPGDQDLEPLVRAYLTAIEGAGANLEPAERGGDADSTSGG